MLALGWLSVESVLGANDHPQRVREVQPGTSLSPELAESLLRQVLSAHKGICQEAELAEWVADCNLALTARIRDDAVIVNRATAFAEWQTGVGDIASEMPEQARRILFTMCGDGFVALPLQDESAVGVAEDDADSDLLGTDDAPSEGEEAAEPNVASRRVYCDLFGGDPDPKIRREREKRRFAAMLYEFLRPLDSVLPSPKKGPRFPALSDELRNELDLGPNSTWLITEPIKPQLAAWRTSKAWNRGPRDLLPREASPDNKKNKIAVPYRKLLVALDLWPQSSEENGAISPRLEKKGQKVRHALEASGIASAAADSILGLVTTLLAACSKKVRQENRHVYKPAWATSLHERFETASHLAGVKGSPEFRYLTFALAARRISQTQSWTRRNEVERHKAAAMEDAARKRLQGLDNDERAQRWLLDYERSRGVSEFRITRRMIGECDAVFNAWKGVVTTEGRKKRTAAVQAQAEKFGDPALYADLSADSDAEVIWQHSEGGDILKEWVKLRQAQYDQQRLKIPRFCHPDPFHHPTWCEFGGSSKPPVWYAWRVDSKPKNPEPGGDADGSRRMWLLLPDFAVRKAKAVPLRWRSKRLSKDLGEALQPIEKAIPRADRLGTAAARLPLLDASGKSIRYRPKQPFGKEAKGWNARLQLSRDALQALQKQWDDERGMWRDAGKALRSAHWFVTFAPALARSENLGRDIHPKLGWKSSPHSELNRKDKREGHAKVLLSRLPGLRVLSVDLGHRFAAACAVWEALDAKSFDIRKIVDKAKADGARIEGSPDGLSVHVIRRKQKERRGKIKQIDETTIYRRIGTDKLPDGSSHPAPWARLDRQFLIKLQGEERPARAATKAEHGIDETALVAKLARALGLLRQDQEGRAGRNVDGLMGRAVRIATLGLKRHGRRAKIAYAFNPDCPGIPGIGGKLTTITRGDDAHIRFLTDALMDWHALATDKDWDGSAARNLWNEHITSVPGEVEATPPDPEAERPTRQEREEVRGRLKPIAEHFAKAEPGMSANIFAAWKKEWKDAEGQPAIVPKVAEGHQGPNRTSAIQPGTGWHEHLRRLTDWIMGWRLPGAQSTHWNRNVGGLSLTRIATMKSLYQLHKAFAMRPRPDKLRGAPERGESNAGVAQAVLDAMERMREQRVKQLASRIAAAALGLGGHWKYVQRRDYKRKVLLGSDGRPRMKRVWVEEPGAKYPACHAVVIEHLRNYRPDELQTRRENRALMNWSAGKVRKYLEEACQLHGLHLREVSPNYTSRQSSRTGFPGVRCVEVAVEDFLRPHWRVKRAVKALIKDNESLASAPWEKRLAAAMEVVRQKRNDAPRSSGSDDSYIAELFARWDAANKTWTDANGIRWKLGENQGKTRWEVAAGQSLRPDKRYVAPDAVRMMSRGGDLFVAAPPWSCRAKDHRPCPLCDGRTLQADLNAAANIGLRALLDPEFAGRWWFIPASIDGGWRVPAPNSCTGAVCLDGWKVAPKEKYLSAAGIPLVTSDDDSVKRAEERVALKKKAVDAAKRSARKTAADPAALTAAKAEYEEAKSALKQARNAASQKEIVNIWQDPRAQRVPPTAGRWRETNAYWYVVKARAVAALRIREGLDAPPETDEDIVGNDVPW